jgi:uncharacterized membrane protein YidH (DUF202 family)
VRTRFRTAAGRILQSVSRSNAMNGIGKKTTLEYKSPVWKLIRMGLAAFLVVISLLTLWFAFVQWRKADQVKAKIALEKRKINRN